MNETTAIIAPAFLLMIVVAGYMFTIFEPYLALRFRSAEVVELLDYHAKDLKLQRIAEWWAARLMAQSGGWYDDSDVLARRLSKELHYELIRHRFLFGDDPSKIRCGPGYLSSILSNALRKLGTEGSLRMSTMPEIPEAVMLIASNRVQIVGDKVIWRGQPAEYKSRFCDMYYDYEPS